MIVWKTNDITFINVENILKQVIEFSKQNLTNSEEIQISTLKELINKNQDEKLQ